MVGRVSYLGRVKQGNYHTHVLYTIPNPNYTLPKPYPFIITYPTHHPTLGTGWESVTLCKYQHYLTLDTYLSFHSDTLPEYLSYPTNRRKNIPPYIEYLPHLPNPRHLSLHTCTHLTLPFIGCWMFRPGMFRPKTFRPTGCFIPGRFVNDIYVYIGDFKVWYSSSWFYFHHSYK